MISDEPAGASARSQVIDHGCQVLVATVVGIIGFIVGSVEFHGQGYCLATVGIGGTDIVHVPTSPSES